MDLSFGAALLIFGALLTVVAALSGVMRGTVLSASVFSVGAGILLAAVGVVHVDPGNEAIVELIELALVLTLFSDGSSSSANFCASIGRPSRGRWRSRCRSRCSCWRSPRRRSSPS